jgi:FMN reductase
MLIGFSANLQRPSKTRALVAEIVERLGDRFGPASLHDLSETARMFGGALQASELTGEAARILGAIEQADALIVASPVHKGSYTGLFKHVFDLVRPDALYGKPVIVAATGGGPRHALVVEHQMRPLFGFFRAQVMPTAVYACDADFSDGKLVDRLVKERVADAAAELGDSRAALTA